MPLMGDPHGRAARPAIGGAAFGTKGVDSAAGRAAGPTVGPQRDARARATRAAVASRTCDGFPGQLVDDG